MVTNLCTPVIPLDFGQSAFSDYFNCTTAGLNLTGSYTDIMDGESQYGRDDYGLIFQYYYDAQKLQQAESGEELVEQGSTQLFWGLIVKLPFLGFYLGSSYIGNATLGKVNTSLSASFGLILQSNEYVAGIVSCETNLSEIVRKSV